MIVHGFDMWIMGGDSSSARCFRSILAIPMLYKFLAIHGGLKTWRVKLMGALSRSIQYM